MTSQPTSVEGAGVEEESSNPLLRALSVIGPGVITGAADDDPSGIGTYAQTGATFGYGLLWMTIVMFPMMVTAQYISAKIGATTRRSLGAVIEHHYPRPVLYVAAAGLGVANLLNAGVDIGAIAAGFHLFIPVSIRIMVIPVAVLIAVLIIFGSFHLIETTFKWLALALLAYVVSAFLSHPNMAAVLRGTFIPSIPLNRSSLSMVVALLGTTVSPYLFFWQEQEEATEDRKAGGGRPGKRHMRRVLLDTNVGMLFSEAVAYFVIFSSAATLHHTAGAQNISSAVQAAQALRPVAGRAATLLWAVGIIGAGILAVPTLVASAVDTVSTIFGWRHGLDQKPSRARAFYILLAVAMVVAALVNFAGINPIQALVLSAVVNGFLTPPMLVLIMLISNNRNVVGDRTNGRLLNVVGWLTTGITTAAAVGLAVTLL